MTSGGKEWEEHPEIGKHCARYQFNTYVFSVKMHRMGRRERRAGALLAGLLLSGVVAAQSLLDGTWSGVLTFRGKEIPMSLQMQVNRKGRIKGTLYLYPGADEVITTRVSGKWYHDRSLSLKDELLAPEGAVGHERYYPRDYQLVFRRSIWESTLEGYWQEQIPTPLTRTSRKGRVFLKKMKTSPKA